MLRKIELSSTNLHQDFMHVPTERWGICRRELEKYFELDDKPDTIEVLLSSEPTNESYKCSLTEMGNLHLITSKGLIHHHYLTYFATTAIRKFNETRKLSYSTPVYISIF